MFQTVYENEDVVVASVDMCKSMHLKCGCTIQLYTLMLVTGLQVKHDDPVICPLHKVEHDFSSNNLFKYYSLNYLKHHVSNESEPFVSTFPPPSQ